MAQFTAQGTLKPLLNGDGISSGSQLKDSPHHRRRCKIAIAAARIPYGFRRRRFGSSQSSAGSRLLASSPSSSSSSSFHKSRHFKLDMNSEVSDGSILDDEDDDEFEIDELSCFRGLVLDISYRPVNVVCWKRAICLEFMEKADVLEYYDQTVNSPGGSFYIPAVLRVPHLLQVVKRRTIKSTLSRKNVFFRDNFTCQYCMSCENLTVDHVLPIARGGKWTWENLVTACSKCNSRKGQKTVEEANMTLHKVPKVPKDYDILAIPLTSTAVRMLRLRKGIPDEWREYLSEPRH